jgi:hypothetical protein
MKPEKIARKFLDFLESRKLADCSKLVADDFGMTWPGGIQIDNLAEVGRFGSGRFQWVKNIYADIEVAETKNGTAVYFIGTLEGKFINGVPFSNIRFVDRVLIKEGLVSELLVWSDLAEELRKHDL